MVAGVDLRFPDDPVMHRPMPEDEDEEEDEDGGKIKQKSKRVQGRSQERRASLGLVSKPLGQGKQGGRRASTSGLSGRQASTKGEQNSFRDRFIRRVENSREDNPAILRKHRTSKIEVNTSELAEILIKRREHDIKKERDIYDHKQSSSSDRGHTWDGHDYDEDTHYDIHQDHDAEYRHQTRQELHRSKSNRSNTSDFSSSSSSQQRPRTTGGVRERSKGSTSQQGTSAHRKLQQRAHDALTERYRRVSGLEPHTQKKARRSHYKHMEMTRTYAGSEGLGDGHDEPAIHRETVAQHERRVQRKLAEERAARERAREEHLRHKEPQMSKGPAPTFEASYARAMSKINEDRARRDMHAARAAQAEEKRREEEFFRVSSSLKGIEDLYKDNRDPHEIKKRDKQHKQKRRERKNGGARPHSAGVLLPSYAVSAVSADQFASAATELIHEAQQRAGIAVAAGPEGRRGLGASPTRRKKDTSPARQAKQAQSASGGKQVEGGVKAESSAHDCVEKPAEVVIAPDSLPLVMGMSGGPHALGKSEFAYSSLPFMPAPFLPLGDSVELPPLREGGGGGGGGLAKSPERSASENFVTSVLQPFQDPTGGRPFVGDSLDSGIYPSALVAGERHLAADTIEEVNPIMPIAEEDPSVMD
jgi:hypothetical protein